VLPYLWNYKAIIMNQEVERRERVIIERMKNLTEEQIIHALYVEASILVQNDLNENSDFKAKPTDGKINIVK